MLRLNLVVLLPIIILISTACTSEGNSTAAGNSATSGGTFVMAENNQIVTLFPLSVTSQAEAIVVSQFHEPLVRLDSKTLEVIPGLVEKWEKQPNSNIMVFHLRKGAHFQDDKCYPNGKGPEITVKDVLFTFNNLATKSEYNYQYNTFLQGRILGVDDYYNQKATSIAGFKIIDDYTFSIELTCPAFAFLKVLSGPAFSVINEVAFKNYGKNLKTGAGPFMYSSLSGIDKIVLVKNPNYYLKDSAGNSLPYLDTLMMLTNTSIEDGLNKFEKGQIDLINTLPSLRVKEIIEKNISEFKGTPPKAIIQHEPEMISQYYVFNITQKPFDDVKVRQAINYAVDRAKIVENILRGQAIAPAYHGITPGTFIGYNINQIKGYNLDIEKAKKLLAEAGYPNGQGFPEMRVLVNSGNSRNSSVAVEIQKQLKENLNINVNFESLPNSQKYDLQMHGKGDVFRDAWVADYPSPESFLSLFSSNGVPIDNNEPSFPNTSRYRNTEFDNYFNTAKNFDNKDSSYAYFMKAEQLLMNDAVIIPLWYEGSYRLLSGKINKLNLNAMRYYDFTKTNKSK